MWWSRKAVPKLEATAQGDVKWVIGPICFRKKEPLTMRGWIICISELQVGLPDMPACNIYIDCFTNNKHELLVPPSGETLTGNVKQLVVLDTLSAIVCKSPVLFYLIMCSNTSCSMFLPQVSFLDCLWQFKMYKHEKYVLPFAKSLFCLFSAA